MISKNYLLLFTSIVTSGLVIVGTFGTYTLCNNNEKCIEVLHLTFLNFVPVAALFLFSLITYWMREDIYRVWIKFALWWIPLSMVLVFLSPEYSSDWMYRIEKGTVAFLTSALFVIISTLIIAGMYLRVRMSTKTV